MAPCSYNACSCSPDTTRSMKIVRLLLVLAAWAVSMQIAAPRAWAQDAAQDATPAKSPRYGMSLNALYSTPQGVGLGIRGRASMPITADISTALDPRLHGVCARRVAWGRLSFRAADILHHHSAPRPGCVQGISSLAWADIFLSPVTKTSAAPPFISGLGGRMGLEDPPCSTKSIRRLSSAARGWVLCCPSG